MRCKKIIIKMVVAIFMLTSCLPIVAFSADLDPFTLRVGYWPGYGMSEDENGNLSGYTYDYMSEIARVNKWEVVFIPCDWAQGMELLRKGQLDLFGPMEWSEERAKRYDYPALSMGEETGALYVQENNNTIFYEDRQSLNGKKLGTMEGNYFRLFGRMCG